MLFLDYLLLRTQCVLPNLIDNVKIRCIIGKGVYSVDAFKQEASTKGDGKWQKASVKGLKLGYVLSKTEFKSLKP